MTLSCTASTIPRARLILGVVGALRHGSPIVHTVRPTPEAYAAASGSLYFGVPTVWSRICANTAAARALTSARLLVSGSAPLPVPLFERIVKLTGLTPIERYGMSETLITLSTRSTGERRPGWVGSPIRGVRTRLLDQSGNPVPHDGETVGRLEVAGDTLFGGYLGNPAKTAESMTADGWFKTGDIAAIDEQGLHRIVGRESVDMIKSGGYRVGAGEVEQALLNHPEVRELRSSVFPTTIWGRESSRTWWATVTTMVRCLISSRAPFDPQTSARDPIRRYPAAQRDGQSPEEDPDRRSPDEAMSLERAEIRTETHRNVAVLIIDHPRRHNALTGGMLDELISVLEQLADDPAISVVVLTGTGAQFCAGMDIRELRSARVEGIRMEDRVTDAEEALAAFPKPTIAAIRGYCIGGGAQLALACDFRVAAEGSEFAVTPAKLGVIYPARTIRRMVLTLALPRQNGW